MFVVWLLVELLEKLREKWSKVEKQPYPAMYSSTYGGIILDPALMVIPIDDHMVHRGHGVFDTVIILNGFLMIFFMLILQVFYGNMVQWDGGRDFSCASFGCMRNAWIRST
ncbi:D-amino-acid transaminase chloroplastic [Prunus yedoensis var. nudiflora]|uniref:D-amino-acid transaminase chloroplastic n=1 Tax=Prunus yedoensis var. nudiflora TaxID=2094558 RepID=A0A314Z4K0_PRUYE|nr:D-amino-acid transaminase chloroplastic [Prunus yedoensis var. nudiflora]